MRGQLIERGDRKWLLRVYVGRVEGKRQYKSKAFQGTTKEAQQELTRMLRESDTNPGVTGTKLTVKAFLDQWLKSKLDVRANTLYDYRSRLEAYVIPAFGPVRLDKLTLMQINGLYQQLVERGLSPRTVRYTHAIFHHALEQATQWGLLVRNPTTHATLPRRVQRTPTVLGAKDIAKLIRETAQEPLGALWTLLLTSGLRPNEALALKWSDLERGAVHVRRTLVNDGHGHYSVLEAEAKTDLSIRVVTLPKLALEALEQHKKRQSAEILLAGPKYQRQDFLFAYPTGLPFDPNNVRKHWKGVLKRLKLPRVRLYDTRHSHASALLSEGVNLAWVSERLGHANIQMTKSVYAHVLPEAQRETAQVMDRIVKEA